MPEPPRLHLNEHLSPRLAVQLRRYGFEAVTSQELGILSQSDEEQLRHAVANKRAVVTFNVADFALLHAQYLQEGQEHWGIVFSTEEPVNVLIHRLLRLLNSVSDHTLKNQTIWLNEYR